jgi:hypothetical protein
MTLTALLISLFIQFGFIKSAADLQHTSPAQKQEWKKIIDDDFDGI